MSKTLLIFSGHNDRAVVALCRALAARGLRFSLVASAPSDPIYQTAWAPYVCMRRDNGSVDISLFERIRSSVDRNHSLVYCPTTEFINRFVLGHRREVEALGIQVTLPSADIYDAVTNKGQSARFIHELCGLDTPSELEWRFAQAPCVFKPRANIMGGTAHYPLLCFSAQEVENAKAHLDPQRWLLQNYIEGQSHYLCGYLSRQGEFVGYWQTNLVQQPGGKSIVLARTGENPGLDEGTFFRGLAAKGYSGPIMMEVIETADRKLFFIEINPRFWGPLQLGVDACPEMIDLYAKDMGLGTVATPVPSKRHLQSDDRGWYAWDKGARLPDCHRYPAALGISDRQLNELLASHDIYNRDDTRRLHRLQ